MDRGTPTTRAHSGPQSSVTKPTMTPAVAAYAGPTFHASPAPSALPIPSFFSKSVPESPSVRASEAQLQHDDSGSSGGDSPTPGTANLHKMLHEKSHPLTSFSTQTVLKRLAHEAQTPRPDHSSLHQLRAQLRLGLRYLPIPIGFGHTLVVPQISLLWSWMVHLAAAPSVPHLRPLIRSALALLVPHHLTRQLLEIGRSRQTVLRP
jgi:hypothetical protein